MTRKARVLPRSNVLQLFAWVLVGFPCCATIGFVAAELWGIFSMKVRVLSRDFEIRISNNQFTHVTFSTHIQGENDVCGELLAVHSAGGANGMARTRRNEARRSTPTTRLAQSGIVERRDDLD